MNRFIQWRAKVAHAWSRSVGGAFSQVRANMEPAWPAGVAVLAGLLLATHVAGQPGREDLRGVEAAERAVGGGLGERTSRPAALIGGRAITWEELRPGLAEAAGGIVLQEAVLDRMLEAEAQQRGIDVGPEELAREREVLVATIAGEARAEAAEAERLLDVVRRSRGLGEHRFERLLKRNAQLRAMVGEVEVEREEVEAEFLLRFGERYRVRIIMTSQRREAGEIRGRLLRGGGEGEDGRHKETVDVLRFAEAAAMHSIDPSAERGGIVDPISPWDPSYPSSVRQAMQRLEPGEISSVLPVDHGYVVLLLEERIAGDDVELPDVEEQIRRDLMQREQRIAMDDLARRLLLEADLTIMDRALDWSWQARHQLR